MSLTEPGPIDRGPPAHGGAGEVNPEQGTLRHPAPSSNDATSPELPVPGKPGGEASLGRAAPEAPPQALRLLACMLCAHLAPCSAPGEAPGPRLAPGAWLCAPLGPCSVPGAAPGPLRATGAGLGQAREPSLNVWVESTEHASIPKTVPKYAGLTGKDVAGLIFVKT